MHGMHGEAGACTWQVVSFETTESGASVTLAAHLRRTCLEVQRTFSVTAVGNAVRVDESMANLVGFERALGTANHITLGDAFLRGRSTRFSCNADKVRSNGLPIVYRCLAIDRSLSLSLSLIAGSDVDGAGRLLEFC